MTSLESLKRGVEELESRVTTLEEAVDDEALLSVKAHHILKQSERHVQELTFQAAEDRSNTARMMDRVAELQRQLVRCAAQLEEAKHSAAVNLAKYREVELQKEMAAKEREGRRTY
ncbi:myosin heavy chain, muscle-like [Penaeus monodon]|uniref:myosin heavy chain, muscle-like n=1 Tax=Penaeus monodon TaxID=6687 RepID=UPI0018A79F78|nr:myosin heavy chain, muscle-like [Penaeus monodon]